MIGVIARDGKNFYALIPICTTIPPMGQATRSLGERGCVTCPLHT